MHHWLGSTATEAGTSCWDVGADFYLWASSDEALQAGTFGRLDPCGQEPEEVDSFDNVEWTDTEPEASSEPDAPSELKADQTVCRLVCTLHHTRRQ